MSRSSSMSTAIATGVLAILAALVTGCSSSDGTGPSVSNAPCGSGGTVQLTVAQSARIDCGSGTTVTLAGNGASYLIVPQFANDQGADHAITYKLATTVAAAVVAGGLASTSLGTSGAAQDAGTGILPPIRPNIAQLDADRMLRAKARRLASLSGRASVGLSPAPNAGVALQTVPPAGSIRSFHVLSSLTAGTFKNAGARLEYVGTNILIYVDTLSPANGFTSAQLQAFGQYFDQTLYGIAVGAFGAPSDIDQNGHVIMLMSPVVNADSPKANCSTQGFIAGFFDAQDFNGPTDPNSNQGEVFYSIVPDPDGTFSCTHTVDNLGLTLPATFLHELEHLIAYSQAVAINHHAPMSSWMDEGLAIVAEELGSLHFEQKCPPPSCRTNPSQIFPDSSQGFVQSFLYDSYKYALKPDSVSLTLHTDDQGGFSWRGGDWLVMRWLGDHMPAGFYLQLIKGPSNALVNIEQASGQSFPSLFANFGISLYTDSIPGFPRNTAPLQNRFVTRNVKQLWARLFTTSGGSSDIPRADPLQLASITASGAAGSLRPGAMAFYRLDSAANEATVSIVFATPTGAQLSTSLRPQLAIFRLPPP